MSSRFKQLLESPMGNVKPLINESDIPRALKKLTNKEFDEYVTSFDKPNDYGFKISDFALDQYIKSFGPIVLVAGKYACQKRNDVWECYDKRDRRILKDDIMNELDIKKFGFSFEDLIDSHQNK